MDWCELRSPPSPDRIASPRLARLARARVEAHGAPPEERCELCGRPVAPEHRHVLDLQSRSVLCACRPCSLLFERDAAGGGHYRLIPDRRLRLNDLELADDEWEQLQIPVDIAFFFRSSTEDRVVGMYPSPMGATESQLELGAWWGDRLSGLEPDVEALLVNRARGTRRQWLVPIDDCYRLVAVIRTRWRGFTGGKEVWLELERFFDDLDRRARSRPPERRPDGAVQKG
jgi:hypothetical protein